MHFSARGEGLSVLARTAAATLAAEMGRPGDVGGAFGRSGVEAWETSGFGSDSHEPAAPLIVCSCTECLPRRFLAALRRQPLLPPGAAVIRREGVFMLVWLPSAGQTTDGRSPADQTLDSGGWTWRDEVRASEAPWAGTLYDDAHDDDPLTHLLPTWRTAACALFLASAADGWDAADVAAFFQLRHAGPPLIPVVVCETVAETQVATTVELSGRLHHALGVAPSIIVAAADPVGAADDSSDDASDDGYALLLRRILAYAPTAAAALGSEAPRLRRQVAATTIRTTAWLTALVGLEPAPLVDLPVQLVMQRRMAQTLAAIYGQPPPGLVSGEGVGLLSAGLALRYANQQLVRLAPGVGWLLSGVLSGVSTWLLGRTLALHYSQALPVETVVARAGALCRKRGVDLVRWALTTLHRVPWRRRRTRPKADGKADRRRVDAPSVEIPILRADELDSTGGAR